MRRARRVLVLAALTGAGTAFGGWWTVPVVAALGSRLLIPGRGSVRSCMLGAALGWAALLGWTALHGPVDLVARRAGGALGLPAWGLVLVTLLFPALLAGAAARAVQPASPS